MTSPSLLSRESTTLSSRCAQKGHFIDLPIDAIRTGMTESNPSVDPVITPDYLALVPAARSPGTRQRSPPFDSYPRQLPPGPRFWRPVSRLDSEKQLPIVAGSVLPGLCPLSVYKRTRRK